VLAVALLLVVQGRQVGLDPQLRLQLQRLPNVAAGGRVVAEIGMARRERAMMKVIERRDAPEGFDWPTA
jgi:hypothetical protein